MANSQNKSGIVHSSKGRALLNAASGDEALAEQFGRLENDFERALWTLMKQAKYFQSAEELHFFDYFAEGSRGQHYRARSNLSVSREADDVDQFRESICKFYRARDGSGISSTLSSLLGIGTAASR